MKNNNWKIALHARNRLKIIFGRFRRSTLKRTVIRYLSALMISISVSAIGVGTIEAAEKSAIRIGVTPVFLDYQTAFLEEWREYLEAKLNRDVKFTQRSSYREIIEMLLGNELEYAWICGFPFVRYRANLRLLAVPVYQGEPLYQSYLIVPQSDDETSSIAELKNKLFAYSDPDSNSGFLVPQYELHRQGFDRSSFFRKTFFTWAHQKVVEAVATGLANGGAVDGYVWDTLEKVNPALTGYTRVVKKSQKFGFPPFVSRRNIAAPDFDSIQNVLIEMARDPQGRQLLEQLNLDGFSIEEENLFDSISEMTRVLSVR